MPKDSAQAVLLACLIAPPASGSILGAAYGLTNPTWLEVLGLTDALFMGSVTGFFFGLLLGCPLMCLIGAPIHSLLVRFRAVALWHYLFAAGAVGLLWALVGYALDGLQSGYWNLSSGMIWWILPAPIGAAIAWLIRRPDRDEPPAQMPQPPAA